MPLLPKTITAPVGRIGAAAQNALEVARFGGLDTHEEPSPYEVDGASTGSTACATTTRARVPTALPAVLLVPPMMLAAEIYDVSPATSAVTLLHQDGADPWVVDFGSPEHEAGGLERTLADHILRHLRRGRQGPRADRP